jgi:hypothetical protein
MSGSIVVPHQMHCSGSWLEQAKHAEETLRSGKCYRRYFTHQYGTGHVLWAIHVACLNSSERKCEEENAA